MSHLAGSTWISGEGRPVKLVFDDADSTSATECPEIVRDCSASLVDALIDAAAERGLEWP
jgi:hypothetical protein